MMDAFSQSIQLMILQVDSRKMSRTSRHIFVYCDKNCTYNDLMFTTSGQTRESELNANLRIITYSLIRLEFTFSIKKTVKCV